MIRVKVVKGVNEFHTMGSIDNAAREALAWAKENPDRPTVLVFNETKIPIERTHEDQIVRCYNYLRRMENMKELPWYEL